MSDPPPCPCLCLMVPPPLACKGDPGTQVSIYICVCVCVCVYLLGMKRTQSETLYVDIYPTYIHVHQIHMHVCRTVILYMIVFFNISDYIFTYMYFSCVYVCVSWLHACVLMKFCCAHAWIPCFVVYTIELLYSTNHVYMHSSPPFPSYSGAIDFGTVGEWVEWKD